MPKREQVPGFCSNREQSMERAFKSRGMGHGKRGDFYEIARRGRIDEMHPPFYSRHPTLLSERSLFVSFFAKRRALDTRGESDFLASLYPP